MFTWLYLLKVPPNCKHPLNYYMASMDPSLIISEPKEQKWVGEISEILNRELEIQVDIPPVSIFHVPEIITTKKPEAYQPQLIGFGPYHHFRPGPYTKMEQKKLRVFKAVLQRHKIKDYRLTVLDKVQKLVPAIRGCYDTFLQDGNASMAWVFAIDGVFLLNLFDSYRHQFSPYAGRTERLRAQDIMMVENQIPFMVLKEIHEALHSSSESEDQMMAESGIPLIGIDEALHSLLEEEEEEEDEDEEEEEEEEEKDDEDKEEEDYKEEKEEKKDDEEEEGEDDEEEEEEEDNIIPFMSSSNKFSPFIFRSFSKIHSPLELCSASQAPTSVEHLLQYMYYSIMANLPTPPRRSKPLRHSTSMAFPSAITFVTNAKKFAKKIP
ncbi:hypothetical protein L1987_32730 [Smallanthus sonchifolius]|uniref:Uncharacterized protein n=1 Tax=Smallanthus sonchifolius TaxID=185202 RepID=A0ACB9HPW7_9ASTR|nr:hypothetical protein L1987_32730 [Smallanthus sonchifolius]